MAYERSEQQRHDLSVLISGMQNSSLANRLMVWSRDLQPRDRPLVYAIEEAAKRLCEQDQSREQIEEL